MMNQDDDYDLAGCPANPFGEYTLVVVAVVAAICFLVWYF